MIGYRIANSTRKNQGLCCYISSELQHYSDISEGLYSLYGYVRPYFTSNAENFAKIGFCCTYRSPSLTDTENDDYFNELLEISQELKSKCDVVYLLGDFKGPTFFDPFTYILSVRVI